MRAPPCLGAIWLDCCLFFLFFFPFFLGGGGVGGGQLYFPTGSQEAKSMLPWHQPPGLAINHKLGKVCLYPEVAWVFKKVSRLFLRRSAHHACFAWPAWHTAISLWHPPAMSNDYARFPGHRSRSKGTRSNTARGSN